jgi:hypothetical protein
MLTALASGVTPCVSECARSFGSGLVKRPADSFSEKLGAAIADGCFQETLTEGTYLHEPTGSALHALLVAPAVRVLKLAMRAMKLLQNF